jgi:hypothetical protein
MSLILGGANKLSGWVCYHVSKEKKKSSKQEIKTRFQVEYNSKVSTKMMKPWQLPLNKATNKRGKNRTKRKDPSLNQVKEKHPKWSQMGKITIISKAPTSHKSISKKKKDDKHEKSKKLKRTFTCYNNAPQNRGGMS